MVDWGYKHRIALISIAVTIVILVGGAFGYRAYLEAETERMTLAFFEIQKKVADPKLDVETRREAARKGYTEFVQANPDERLTPIAWMHLARLAWDAQASKESREAYRTVMDHGESTPRTEGPRSLGIGQGRRGGEEFGCRRSTVPGTFGRTLCILESLSSGAHRTSARSAGGSASFL